MTNSITIYSGNEGFDSRFFYPLLLQRQPTAYNITNPDGNGSYTNASLYYSWHDQPCEISIEGTYLKDRLTDVSGYLTSATFSTVVNGETVTLATMKIFLDETNPSGIPLNSVAWMTPDALLLAAENNGGEDYSLIGGNGTDKLFGSRYGDYFNGGLGRDTLTGYAGKDQFLFDAIGKANADHITDFAHKQDKILIDQSDDPELFGDLTQSSNFRKVFHDITNSAEEKDDRILYNHKTGTLSFDDDGSGKHKAVVFAYIDNHAKLDFHDFAMF